MVCEWDNQCNGNAQGRKREIEGKRSLQVVVGVLSSRPTKWPRFVDIAPCLEKSEMKQ